MKSRQASRKSCPGFRPHKSQAPRMLFAFKEFSASGLTFLFLASLRRASKTASPTPALGGKYLALAATGTVADLSHLSPQTGFWPAAASAISTQTRAPLFPTWPLTAGLSGKTLTAGHISFYLGPRINAAGRISRGKSHTIC